MEQIRRRVMPSHAYGMAPGRYDGILWRIDRSAGVNDIADRTAIVAARLTGLFGGIWNRSGVAMANGGRTERVGGGDAGGPRRADRRKNLRQHRNQDDWKKFSQPAHDPTFPTYANQSCTESGVEFRFPRPQR